MKAALLALGALLIAGPAFGDADCRCKGATSSRGSAVCQSGSQYRCDDGQWSGLAIACTESLPVGAKSCAFDFVAVLPGAGGRKASFYVNHRVPESQVADLINPTSGRYEDSILQDLTPAIENTILQRRVRQ